MNKIGKNDFLVSVTLDKKWCWVRDSTTLLADEILAHEQLHFDICELVARRLRLRIVQASQAGQNIFGHAFGKEVEGFMAEFDKLEDMYDQQTDHGIIVSQQKKWSERVKSELAGLSRYKSSDVTCVSD